MWSCDSWRGSLTSVTILRQKEKLWYQVERCPLKEQSLSFLKHQAAETVGWRHGNASSPNDTARENLKPICEHYEHTQRYFSLEALNRWGLNHLWSLFSMHPNWNKEVFQEKTWRARSIVNHSRKDFKADLNCLWSYKKNFSGHMNYEPGISWL